MSGRAERVGLGLALAAGLVLSAASSIAQVRPKAAGPGARPPASKGGATARPKPGDRPGGPDKPGAQSGGRICVVKFNDLNGDGVKQANEGVLPGWSFTVSGGPIVPQSGITNANGTWCTSASLTPWSYTVKETMQPGWISTAPGGANPTMTVSASWGSTTTVYFGNRKPAAPTGKICVEKFNDTNNNGVRDAGEALLPGWTFTRTGGGIASQTGVTGSSGKVCFDAPAGGYTITETLQAGWISTSPGGPNPARSAVVTGGQTITLKFGNRQAPTKTGRVCVEKFEDTNGNGKRDAGEAALAGWTFSMVSGLYGQTDAKGRICWDLPPGNYSVHETMQPGWVSTNPGGQSPTKTFTVISGQTVVVSFGNRKVTPQNGKLCVTKYWDQNGSGTFNGGESKLAGWTFTLSTGQTGVTNELGQVCWTLPVGSYTVAETMQAGWVSSDPGGTNPSKPVTLTTAGANLMFGNRRTTPQNGKLCVTKYWDQNANGAFNSGESKLAGWTFTLSSGQTGVTNEQGQVCWTVPVGSYTVTETMQSGWVSSDPGGTNPSKPITLTTAGANLMFGNRRVTPQTAVLCVTKYEDQNANGAFNNGEPKLSGWTFTLSNGSSSTTVTTNHLGQACWTLPLGTYTLTETMQTGWVSTDPGGSVPSKTVTLTSGGANVMFGNRQNAQPGEICVEKYNDLNGNGVRDAGEPPLSGWTFTRTGGGAATLSGTTGANGRWCPGTLLAPGAYTLTETTKPNWINTDPGGSSPSKTVTLGSNQTLVVQFGNRQNAQPGELCVAKYNDLNGNGVRDAGEPALAGWTFTRSGGGIATQSGVTNQNGRWCPAVMVPPGVYTVTETPQSGWTNTDPGGNSPSKTVTIGSNQTVVVEFGNRQAPTPALLTLTKQKYTPGSCHGSQPGANNCTFRFTVVNTGGTTYTGPLTLTDVVTLGGPLPITAVVWPTGWTCSTGPVTPMVCTLSYAGLPPNSTTVYDFTFQLNGAAPAQNNCAVLSWGGQQTGQACVTIFP